MTKNFCKVNNNLKIKYIKNIVYCKNNIIFFSILNKNSNELIYFILNKLKIINQNILFSYFFLKDFKDLFFMYNYKINIFNKKNFLKNNKIFFLKFKFESDLMKFIFYYIDNKINLEENKYINICFLKHKNMFIDMRHICLSKNELVFFKKEILLFKKFKLCYVLMYNIKLIQQVLNNFIISNYLFNEIIILLK